MKLLMTICCLLMCAKAYGQTPSATDRDWRLPLSLKLKQDAPRTYRFTVDYYYSDTRGRPGRRERVSALYTRDLPGSKAKWTAVAVAASTSSPESLGPAAARDFMEGFSYTVPATEMLKADFFKGFPTAPAAIQERNLVWDTRMFEFFAHDNFEHLELNTAYHVPEVSDVPIAEVGNFQHKDLQLIWTGIARRNDQECAVIDYQAFFNNIDLRIGPAAELIGRSHYWGQIWVSLTTRQIEYATLFEDVLGETSMEGQGSPQTVNVFRSGVFELVKGPATPAK